MQVNGDADRALIEALQVATRDLLAVALQSLDRVSGIRLQHMRLLIAVHENPGAASVVLAESLGVSPSSVTRQADRLCDAGYLTRDQPADNRRMVVLTLTSEGERIVDAVLGYRAEVFGKAVLALDPTLRADLTSGLGRLHQALHGSAADLFIVPARAGGTLGLYVVDAHSPGVVVEALPSFDGTRPLARVRLSGAPAEALAHTSADGLERVIRNYLDGITLQDLLEQQTARAANDYVI